jgi:hypothetical protein
MNIMVCKITMYIFIELYIEYIHCTHGIFSWNRPVFVYQAMAAKRP